MTSKRAAGAAALEIEDTGNATEAFTVRVSPERMAQLNELRFKDRASYTRIVNLALDDYLGDGGPLGKLTTRERSYLGVCLDVMRRAPEPTKGAVLALLDYWQKKGRRLAAAG